MSVNQPFGSNPFEGSPTGSAPPPHIPPPGYHHEVNTLATLSVVFAVVFAPAGAILGHLGLGQIAARGQRGRERALVGVTLSYALIVATIVALVVWAGLRGNVNTRSAAPATTPPAAAAATPTTTTVAPPPPTVAPVDLAGLLPSIDDDRNFIGNQNLTVAQTMTQITPDTPDTSPVLDRDECYGLIFSASAHAYDGTGVTGLYGTESEDRRDPANLTLTAHVVAAFPNAAAARAQLKGQLDKWPPCTNATLSYTRPDGRRAGFASASIFDAGNGITTVELRQVEPVLPGATVREVHALASKGNVVIDVETASRGTGTIQFDAALAIVNFILSKIPGPR